MKLKNRSRQRRALIPHHFSKSYHINAPRLKAVLTLFIAFFLCLLVFAIVFNFSETTLARGVLIPAPESPVRLWILPCGRAST